MSIWHPFVQMSRGVKFQEEKLFKEIPSNSSVMGVHFGGLVQISERSFKNAKIIKKAKTGMGLLHQSRNRQTNIQRALQKNAEMIASKATVQRLFVAPNTNQKGA